jgi:GT2 family glycosyltransferase
MSGTCPTYHRPLVRSFSPSSSSPTISVVIPTYHRPDALRETLAALAALDYSRESYELIVVDDGADPSTGAVVDQFRDGTWAPRLLVGEGRGAATARNRGAEVARNELLLFCDDDVIVGRSHLHRHVEVQKLRGPCMCTSFSELDQRVERVLETKAFGRYWLSLEASYWAAVPKPEADGLAELDLLSARNLCLPRAGFEGLNGFDEGFPFAGAEDQDLSIRAPGVGLRKMIDYRNRVRHLETRIDFQRFCRREETGSQSYAVLARKFPDTAGRSELARLNDPASPPGEGIRARLKRLTRRTFGRAWALRPLHALVRALELLRAPDPVMRRTYAAVVGLHIAKGYREGLNRDRPG